MLSIAITLGVSAFLHEVLGLSESLAAGGGLASALTANFFALRYVVFAGTMVSTPLQLVGYLGSSGAFRAAEYCGFLLLNAFIQFHYLVTLVIVLGASFFMKFLVYEKWIFKRGVPDPQQQTEVRGE